MKRTAKSWVFYALQILFMLVVPCAFIWLQSGSLESGYKVSVTAIMLTILIFWVFKKVFLNKWLNSFAQKIINIETNALTITDKSAIETNKKAWRSYSVIQLAFNVIIPLLIFILAIITIKVVEQGLIKLFGCLIFCLVSIIIGFIFRIAEIYSIKFSHE